MQQATEQLIKKMQDDKNFAEKILTCTENDEVIALAKEEEVDLTLENIAEVNEVLQFAQRMEEGELTEEELEQVAGGTIEWVLTAMSVSTVVSVAVTTAALSAAVSATVMSLVEENK